MKGVQQVSSELSPEISPVIIVEDNSAEWQFLQAVRLCSSSMLQSAVAGETTIFRLRNPVSSGVIGRVDYIGISGDVEFPWFVGFGTATADLGTPGATALRDHRWATGANATTLIASRANNVALSFTDSILGMFLLGNTFVAYEKPIILLPGEILELGTPFLNVALRLVLSWTERQLTTLEE